VALFFRDDVLYKLTFTFDVMSHHAQPVGGEACCRETRMSDSFP